MSESEEEEDEEDEDELYEFVATGENSCERCAALNGTLWRQPPNPPHAHCECEVQVRPAGMHKPRDCGDNQWSIQSLSEGTVNYGPADGDFGFEWGFLVTIDCWDGGVYEFEIWVDMGKNSEWPNTDDVFDNMDAFAWSEIHDEAEAVAAQVCRPCSAPVVS